MAWNAQGQWEPDEQQPVTQQTAQLSGLLSSATSTGMQTTAMPSITPTPTGTGTATTTATPTTTTVTATPTPTPTTAPGVPTPPSNMTPMQQNTWNQLQPFLTGEGNKTFLGAILYQAYKQGKISWLQPGGTGTGTTTPAPGTTPIITPAPGTTAPPPGGTTTTPPPGTTTPPPGGTTPPATTPPGATTPAAPATPFVTPGTNGGLTTTAVSGEAPTAENASVSQILTGMLADNNPYMVAAREAGLRAANRRGMLNSSIAAGASEASAIAAAAPLASQEASQIHQRNQTAFEGWNQLRNSSAIQNMSDTAAMERQKSQEINAQLLQTMGDTAAMERLIKQGSIETALQEMRNSNALTQTQINANVSLLSNYMQSFATLSSNPELPASARNAYMQEFIRTTSMGQGLVNALAGTTVTWPGG